MDKMVKPSDLEYRLDAIRLENFMGFEDTGWIELRPITLLFGRNSAGKSAIIRALLLLKQSMTTINADSPLIFTGDLVDLGNYRNTVFIHKISEDIAFSFRVSRERRPKPPIRPEEIVDDETAEEIRNRDKLYEDILHEYDRTQATWTKADRADVEDWRLEIRISFGLLPDEKRPRMRSIEMYGYRAQQKLDLLRVKIFGLDYDADERRWLPSSQITPAFEQFTDSIWEFASVELSHGFMPTLKVVDQAELRRPDLPIDWDIARNALEFFAEHVHANLQSMTHLPSLRDATRRYYTEDVEWVTLLADLNDEHKQLIDQWLQKASVDASVEIQRFDENESVFSLHLLSQSSFFSSNLRDVGVGVGQALPVIVKSLQSGKRGIVIVEQPELHLHPEAQTALADIFVELAQKGTKFIIETHSEHFLLRLQRRVAETYIETISPDRVSPRNEGHFLTDRMISLQFVTRKENTSFIEHIFLDKAGRLFTQDKNGAERDTSDQFNAFFRTDYEDARLLGRAMSEILSQTTSRT